MGASFPRSTLKTNMNVMQEACLSKYVVVTGIIISSISSALGSLFGGSRVLQALARDDLFRFLKYFAKGTDHGDEPRRGVFFTWFFAQCCLFLGDIDAIAPLITSFFCMSYALCNLTAFALSVTGAPNFRPTWKYYSWQLSLLGFVMNIFVMFYLDLLMSGIAVFLLMVLFFYVWWRHPPTDWGDISQALMYHQVRKYLLKIDGSKKVNAKFWRPSVLLFVDDYSATQIKGMVNFCREIKKGGLMVLGSVIVGDVSGLGGLRCNTVAMPLYRPSVEPTTSESRTQLNRGVSFYNEVATALANGDQSPSKDTTTTSKQESKSVTFDSKVKNTNVMTPRQSMYGLKRDGSVPKRLLSQNGNLPVRNSTEYLGVVEDALSLRLNVLVGCNTDVTPDSLWRNKKIATNPTTGEIFTKKNKTNIDVWILGEWTGSFDNSNALSVQPGSILQQRRHWKNISNLRVMCIPDQNAEIKAPPKTPKMPKKKIKTNPNVTEEQFDLEDPNEDEEGVTVLPKVPKTCRHCANPLSGIARGVGRKLGSIPKGFCNLKCFEEAGGDLEAFSKLDGKEHDNIILETSSSIAYLRSVERDLVTALHNARITQVQVKAVSPNELNGLSLSNSKGNAVEQKISGPVKGLPLEMERAKMLNKIIQRESGNAALIMLVMPPRPSKEDCVENRNAARSYLQNVETLTIGLPATYLVVAGERRSVMTTVI